MSKSIKVFQNKEFGTVRSLIINDEPYFVGKDVAEILGYRETAKAIRTHVDEEDKGVSVLDTPGGRQQITLINESGLYCLILSSNLPVAKKFKRWITSEVLPEIHRKGSYSQVKTENILKDPLLTAPAKTIFMYLSSCAEGKSEFITNRSKVLHDLNIGSDMYKNHLDKLKNLGYVSTERIRGADGRIGGVKFIINYNKLLSLNNEFAIGELE